MKKSINVVCLIILILNTGINLYFVPYFPCMNGSFFESLFYPITERLHEFISKDLAHIDADFASLLLLLFFSLLSLLFLFLLFKVIENNPNISKLAMVTILIVNLIINIVFLTVNHLNIVSENVNIFYVVNFAISQSLLLPLPIVFFIAITFYYSSKKKEDFFRKFFQIFCFIFFIYSIIYIIVGYFYELSCFIDADLGT